MNRENKQYAENFFLLLTHCNHHVSFIHYDADNSDD